MMRPPAGPTTRIRGSSPADCTWGARTTAFTSARVTPCLARWARFRSSHTARDVDGTLYHYVHFTATPPPTGRTGRFGPPRPRRTRWDRAPFGSPADRRRALRAQRGPGPGHRRLARDLLGRLMGEGGTDRVEGGDIALPLRVGRFQAAQVIERDEAATRMPCFAMTTRVSRRKTRLGSRL